MGGKRHGGQKAWGAKGRGAKGMGGKRSGGKRPGGKRPGGKRPGGKRPGGKSPVTLEMSREIVVHVEGASIAPGTIPFMVLYTLIRRSQTLSGLREEHKTRPKPSRDI